MITKKQFEEIYYRHSPNKCELFYIKYISITSLFSYIWPAIISSLGLIAPFLITLYAKIFGLRHFIYPICSGIYIAILAIIGIYTFIIWYKRRKRIKLICKELKWTEKQYKEFVKKYYYENYYPDIKDYINSILPDE